MRPTGATSRASTTCRRTGTPSPARSATARRASSTTATTRALLESFQEHATLVRAVVEAAGYDEQIAAQWSSIVRRIIDGAALRLQTADLAPDRAASTATALVWMTERTCYQQAVRDDTDQDDQHIVAAISDVWWNTISAATHPS